MSACETSESVFLVESRTRLLIIKWRFRASGFEVESPRFNWHILLGNIGILFVDWEILLSRDVLKWNVVLVAHHI